jgi:hypothetical protein
MPAGGRAAVSASRLSACPQPQSFCLSSALCVSPFVCPLLSHPPFFLLCPLSVSPDIVVCPCSLPRGPGPWPRFLSSLGLHFFFSRVIGSRLPSIMFVKLKNVGRWLYLDCSDIVTKDLKHVRGDVALFQGQTRRKCSMRHNG